MLRTNLTLPVDKILGIFIRNGQPFLNKPVLCEELDPRIFHGIKAYHMMNGARITYLVIRTRKNTDMYMREGIKK